MPLIGFLFNYRERASLSRDFALLRIAPMDEVLRSLGSQLFVYSPRRVDPENGLVKGYMVEGGRFVETTAPVPEVNGSWFLGSDRSLRPSMSRAQFTAWTAERDIQLYPVRGFARLLKDKYKTFQLVHDVDPALHPYTELYDGSEAQLSRFLKRYGLLFLKPRFGNRGDRIFSIKPVQDGFLCTYYASKQQEAEICANLAEAVARVSQPTSEAPYILQHGLDAEGHDDAPFIFRVIMLDDGQEWQWVHKAVMAAPGSEIANSSQGGSNWATIDLLTQSYGASEAERLLERLRHVSVACTRHLDKLYPGQLMEVAFDFMLDEDRNVQVIEINTQPGMTKPGLPSEPAFRDILNLSSAERELYDKYVLPHGSCLARFLSTKLEERRKRGAKPFQIGAKLDMSRVASSPGDAGAGIPHEQTMTEETPTIPSTNLAGTAKSDIPRLPQAIASQARYLAATCLASGEFRYRVNMNPKVNLKPRYNVLRHAGTIYALDYYDRWQPDEEVRGAAQRAGQFLKDECMAPIPGQDHLLGIWSRPELNHSSKPEQVKLGGVGLGLVALLSLERQCPGFTPLEDLRRLGEFLRWAQKSDGSFESILVPSRGGWKQGWTSLYYPGEAALALLMLHELDPRPEWVQAAADALGYLARLRENTTEIPADHWALLATARLLPVLDQAQGSVRHEAVVQHAQQVCESILAEQVWDAGDSAAAGGFALDGRTTPTATRLEGLLAVQMLLREHDVDLGERIGSAVEEGIDFLLRAQIQSGPFAGGMPRAIESLPSDGSREARTFNRRSTEIRIDYVQHALCALIQYARLSGSSPGTPQPEPGASTRGADVTRGGDVRLFTPGPLTTSREVKEAMLRDLGSRDSQFITLVKRVRGSILHLAGVSVESGFEAVLMQGSGTFAIESVISSTIPQDGVLLVITNGAYGDRLTEMASALKIKTEVLRFDEHVVPDPDDLDRMLAGRSDITHVAAVHCETSTGMVNPVGELGAIVSKHGRSYMIDSMSGLGALPVDLESWGVDYLVSSANKCIQGVPGFAFVICRRTALEASQGHARTLSLDLFAQWKALEGNGQFRFTPPTHTLLAFEVALQELEQEGGPAARGQRYRANHDCLVQGMRGLGFREYLAPELQGPIITTFLRPDDPNFHFDEFYQRLHARGFAIYPGKVTRAECFRIGTIGHIFQDDVRALVQAVEVTLQEMGVNLLD